MPNMPWYDFYKIFNYAFEGDPQTKRAKTKGKTGAGYAGTDMMPYIRDGELGAGGKGMLRVGNDLIDTSSAATRQSRLKEYERLRSMPEIEQVMTVIADEACVAGDTEVETLSHGTKTIKWLSENIKDEFFVYCWDFEKNDYSLGVAYAPRLVKKAKTLKIILDDGSSFVATHDHLVLLRNGAWSSTNGLKFGDELMPFYRINPSQSLTNNKKNQFPRIFSHIDGWKHERQFIDEWKTGRKLQKYEKVNQAIRMLTGGLTCREVAKLMKHPWCSIESWFKNEGFSFKEIKWLGKKSDRRRVVGIVDGEEQDVYDLSVKEHKNFCGSSIIFHNCQKNSVGNVIEINVKNEEVKDELTFLFLHREMLNLNRKIWGHTKRLCINGDWFGELIINIENPKDGILKMVELPPETMYRLETTKSKLLEFQQSLEGPDYEALNRPSVMDSQDVDLETVRAIRFMPEQIVHMRLGEDRKTFYPYGQSLIEAARGPAYQLKMMEDSMVVYRMSRAPERRVFYIDVGQLPSYRAETFMSRMQDLLRKKKVTSSRGGEGASAMDERFSPASADEDFWIPVRPNSNTRIETLPGAQNLGEIDDAVYFRNKLYIALNFPQNYFSNEDVGATRITLSSQVIKFARMLERIQENIEDGLWQIADRHLKLRGFPEETYEDLKIKMIPPSEWRDLSRAEVENNRINNANALKGSLLLSDWDILTKILKYSESDAEQMISRMKNQKIEEAKLQVLVQNPQLMGIGVPGAEEEQMGTEPGSSMPPPPPDGTETPPPADDGSGATPENTAPPTNKNNAQHLEMPDEDEIKHYGMEIQNYGREIDAEEPDWSEA